MTLADTLFASTTGPDAPRALGLALGVANAPRGYLRAEFLSECGHDGLMRLLSVIARADDRDAQDDLTLDAIALELARRQSPLCAVCATGATGACDERCDRIAGAR
jgi:hypothetical protein